MKLISLVLASLLLAGCGTLYTMESGTKTLTPENVAKIVDKKTTKADVRAMFGNPMTMTTNQFGETWMYTRATRGTNVAGLTTQMESHGLVITFGENGVVKTKSYSVTQPVGSGIQQE